nr:beta-galactosidase trimerization domain-containing protein [Microbacterium immunditiarum]
MTRLGAELASFAPPVGSDADGARVAVVLDVENWWALEAPDLPVRVDFSHVVQRWYRALHAAHIAVDLVPSTADLSSYRLVIAPQLFLLSDSAAEGLRRFAEAGGVLFVGAYSDVVDESGRIRDGGHLRGLGETLGVGVAGHFALALRDAAASVPVEGSVAFAGESLVEDVRPMSGTEVVSRFGGGRFVDRPALTRVAVGEGSAWYAATIPDAAGTATLVARMLADARVSAEVPGLPASVEFMRRGELVTLIAHGEQVTVDLRGWETLDGRRLADRELVALDVLHMRRAAVAGGER